LTDRKYRFGSHRYDFRHSGLPHLNSFPVYVAAIATIGSLVAGCASLPQYDSTTDTNLTSLQKEIDWQIVEWTSDANSTDATTKAKLLNSNNIDFYNKVDTDIESVELRMEAVPDASNQNLPQYFTNLRQMLTNLKAGEQGMEALTPSSNLSSTSLAATRWQFAAQFAPLITYELQLKGVSSPKKAKTSSASTDTAKAKSKNAT